MPKRDNLKDRLEELFSAVSEAAPEEAAPGVQHPLPAGSVPPTSFPESASQIAEHLALPVEPEAEAVLSAEEEREADLQEVQPTAEVAEPVGAAADQGSDELRMFLTAFENASVGMCVTGTDGCFISVNQALCQILGYTAQELEGKSFQALTHPEDQSLGGEALRMMLSGMTDRAHIQKRYLRKNGEVIWADLNISLIRQDGKPAYFVTLLQDISESRRTSLLLDKRIRELNCLNEIGHKIDEKPTLPDFLQWVCETLPQAFLHPEVCIAAIEYQGQLYGDPRAVELPSKMVGGLRLGDELLGWLHVAYTEPSYFVDEESAFIGNVISRLTGYIENQRQTEKAELQAQELLVLNEMGRALAAMLDLEQICQTIRQYGARLMDVSNIFIALYDEETGLVSFPMAYSDDQPVEIPTRRLGHSLTDHILMTGQPLLLKDHVIEQMQQLGIEFVMFGDDEVALSWLGVPIQYAGRTIGVIAVQTTKIPGLFQERQRDLLSAIANQAANALMTARQFARTQAALASSQQSRNLLQAIVDNSPDWVFVKDREHRFILVNQSFAHALKHKPEDFIGKDDLEMGFPPEAVMGDPEKGIQGYWWDDQRVLDTGEPIIQPEEPNEVDGVPKVFSVYKTALRDENGQITGILGIARDITLLKQNERVLTKRATELAAVAEVSTAVATLLEPQQLLQSSVDSVREKFGLYHAHVYLLDNSGENLVLAAGTGEAGRLMVERGWQIPLAQEQSLVARSARQRQGVIVNDVRADPGFLPNELLPNTAAELAVPLIAGNELLGVWDVQSDQVGYFTEEDVRIQSTLATQLATSLRTASLYQSVQKALADAEALYTGSSLISQARDAQGVLNALVATTCIKQMEQASILLFDQPWKDRQPDSLTVLASWQKSGVGQALAPGLILSWDEFPLTRLFERGVTLTLDDMRLETRLSLERRSSLEQNGVRSLVISPLTAGTEWIGVVVATAAEVQKFDSEETRRLESLMDQASTVIQNLMLQRDMQARLEELTSLQRAMSRQAWTEYRAALPETQRGYLYDRLDLQPLSPDQISAFRRPQLPKNGSRRSGRSGNLQTESAEGSAVPAGGVVAPATVPLLLQGERIGVLGVHPEAGQALTPEDEAFLQAVAEQVAQALERARLMEAMQKAALELQGVADVGTATSTILDPDELLQAVVDMTKANFNLYHAHIYLLDESGEYLTLAAGAGEVGRSMVKEGWSIPVDQPESLVARAARGRTGVLVPDVRTQANFLPNPMLPDTRAELAVPMVVGDRVLGVFDVQSDTPGRFSSEDLRIYLTLAAQVAIALQNARLYAEQTATVERLRELDNMKSAFLANMSHELRTPLNSILGFTQVLLEGLDGELTEMMAADLELIEKNGKHLLELINDVLDMAKIEAGRLALSLEPSNVYDLLDEVIISSASLAREKGLYIRLQADETQDWMAMVDQVRLRQIFINLIGNSIKFTETGGIDVEMERLSAPPAAGGDRIQIRVRDTGIGIPPDKLEEIFEAFTQVDSSTTRKTGGTGLGLPISRRLVELHHGRLWAESQGIPGEGSVFYLELPVAGPETL